METNQDKVMEFMARDRASRDALPGPVEDAFAINPSIKVGPHTVRPVYDIDFLFLKMFEHPLHEYMLSQDKKDADIAIRGERMWELCYLFTRSVDDVEEVLKHGVDVFRENAKEEFGKKYGLAALLAIASAIFSQFTIYWKPAMAYTSNSNPDGKGDTHFFRDSNPQTHSDGG